MFISNKSGKPAWLISHDSDVVYSVAPPADGERHYTVTSAEFFSAHREASAEELAEHTPRLKGHAAIHLPKAKPAAKPKAAGKASKKASGRATPSKAASAAAMAARSASKPADADKPPPPPPGGGGEPHGE